MGDNKILLGSTILPLFSTIISSQQLGAIVLGLSSMALVFVFYILSRIRNRRTK